MNASRYALLLALALSALACSSDTTPAGPLCHVEGKSCADGIPCCRRLTCEDSVCRPLHADAGAIDAPDASAPDASAPDASIPDASFDDPTHDAGAEPDAGEAADAGSTMEPGDAGGASVDGGPSYWTKVAVDGGSLGSYDACVGTAWPLEAAAHLPEPTPIAYPRTPPVSGPHWPCWAPWATATRPLPPERFVHNLEHAGIVLLYRCDTTTTPDGGLACPDDQAALEAFVAAQPLDATGRRRFLISSNAQLATRYAAVAWGWSLERDALDPAEFACFAAAHLEQGPENYGGDPSPATCPHVFPP